MKKIKWANLLHIYQPSGWPVRVIGKVAQESYRPLFQALRANPKIKITLNICGSLTEQLLQYGFADILDNIRYLASRQQIELTGSAKFHPLLALLPSSEIERQVQLNYDVNRKAFGSNYEPTGFFIPEMCYSPNVTKVIKQFGYSWTILDEISLSGRVGEASLDTLYGEKESDLAIVFRNRVMSDLFFIDNLKRKEDFFKALNGNSQSRHRLITGFDGEYLGHHNPRGLKTWLNLVRSDRFETITYSELISSYRRKVMIKPIASSWASKESELQNNEPYYLWSNKSNPIHARQWELTNLVLRQISSAKTETAGYNRARNLLDQALASDQYWWAAASPWWDVDIVLQAAKRLTRVLHLLGVNRVVLQRALRIYNEINKLVNQWQKSGVAEKIKKDYLRAEAFTRYFGGKKVN